MKKELKMCLLMLLCLGLSCTMIGHPATIHAYQEAEESTEEAVSQEESSMQEEENEETVAKERSECQTTSQEEDTEACTSEVNTAETHEDVTEDEEEHVTEYVYEDKQVKVTAHLTDAAALPDDSQLIVKKMAEGEKAAAYIDEDSEKAIAYDVSFVRDGKEIEPSSGQVKVTFAFKKKQLSKTFGTNDELTLTHIKDDGERETLSSSFHVTKNTLSFQTDSFSIIVISLSEETRYPRLDYIRNGTTTTHGVRNRVKKMKGTNQTAYCMNYDRGFSSSHEEDDDPEAYEHGYVEYSGELVAYDEDTPVANALAYAFTHGCRTIDGLSDAPYSTGNFLYDYYVTQMTIYAILGTLDASDPLYPGAISIDTMAVYDRYEESAMLLSKVKAFYQDAMKAKAMNPVADVSFKADQSSKALALTDQGYQATFHITGDKIDSYHVKEADKVLKVTKTSDTLTVLLPFTSASHPKETYDITLEADYQVKKGAILKSNDTSYQNVGYLAYTTEKTTLPLKLSVTLTPAEITLELLKRDALTKHALKNAVFTLYSDADCQNVVTILTTDVQGKAQLTLTPQYASYYIKETEAPEGYQCDARVYELTDFAKHQNFSIAVDNTPRLISISGHKKWLEEPAAGKEIVVLLYADHQRIASQTVTADNRWRYHFDDLPEYADGKKIVYTIQEETMMGYRSQIQDHDIINTPLHLKVTKRDLTDGSEVKGASIVLYDVTEGTPKEVVRWVSDGTVYDFGPYVTVGHQYRLRETVAPDGYLKMTDVDFTVDEEGVIDCAKNDCLELFDDVTKVAISKRDITSQDEIPGAHLSLQNAKGDVIASWVSGHEPHQLTKLSVGESYTLTETLPADGYATAESITFTVAATGDVQQVVMYDEKTQVAITKSDVTNGNEIAGAHLMVTTDDDEVVDEWASDTQPHLITGLIVGKTYHLIEAIPADGYVTAAEITFVIKDTGEVQKVEMKDDITRVDITKKDLTNGEEIAGAHLKVVDVDGRVIDEWVSETTPHRIERLTVGDTYTLIETLPASGYTTAELIDFVVADTAEVQAIEMQDDVTKLDIRKVDENGRMLAGATLQLLDAHGEIVAQWRSTKKAFHIERLKVGVYTLHEEAAPQGYRKAPDQRFELRDDSTCQEVTMRNTRLKTHQVVKTGDESAWLMPLVTMSATLGVMLFMLWLRKKLS